MTTEQKEDLKQKILIELYNTGRVNGLYFGRTSKLKVNPLKKYIEICLFKNFMLQNGNEYLEDCYQELFLQLQKIPTDKFIELYLESDTRLISYVLRVALLKLFAVDKRTNNPKHSFAKHLNYASVFNRENFMINHLEVKDEDNPPHTENSFKTLIIYDAVEEGDEFEKDYGFRMEDIYLLMTPEQRFVFEKVLNNKKRGKPSAADQLQKQKLFDDIREIKEYIELKNNQPPLL